MKLPSSVESIEMYAFSWCKSLESVAISDFVTKIDSKTFHGCNSLKEITLGKSVTELKDYALSDCENLSSIFCYAPTPPCLDNTSFKDTNIGQITLYVPRESLESYKASNSWRGFADICPLDYYLSYYVDGSLFRSELLDIGTHVTPLAEPEKEGYTFSGWDTIPSLMPTHDVNVYGHFTVNTYKVTYMVGNEVVHVDSVAYGSPIPAYEYTPKDENAVFNGWIGEHYDAMPAFDVVYTADTADGIRDIILEQETSVYDLSGLRICSTSDWNTLKRGAYIVNGRKVRKE